MMTKAEFNNFICETAESGLAQKFGITGTTIRIGIHGVSISGGLLKKRHRAYVDGMIAMAQVLAEKIMVFE